METVPGVFIPKKLLWSPQGGNGMESKRPGSRLPRWFFGVFFLLRKCFCILFVQLKNSSGEKKGKQNVPQVKDVLVSGKVKANLDKTGALPDTKI